MEDSEDPVGIGGEVISRILQDFVKIPPIGLARFQSDSAWLVTFLLVQSLKGCAKVWSGIQ